MSFRLNMQVADLLNDTERHYAAFRRQKRQDHCLFCVILNLPCSAYARTVECYSLA